MCSVRTNEAWLTQFLSLPNGIPCPDTFRRVFVERIDPSGFERCFQRWVSSLVNTLGAQVIPIDGKTLKGSYDREEGKTALHIVSAWDSEHRYSRYGGANPPTVEQHNP